jgi:hypothetical protein
VDPRAVLETVARKVSLSLNKSNVGLPALSGPREHNMAVGCGQHGSLVCGTLLAGCKELIVSLVGGVRRDNRPNGFGSKPEEKDRCGHASVGV